MTPAAREADVEARGRRAYFRRFGEGAAQPGMVEIGDGRVSMTNVNGLLAVYRITSSGGLRWVGTGNDE